MGRVLTVDAQGQPTDRHLLVASDRWEDIEAFTDTVYAPLTVRPLGRERKPHSVLRAAAIGGFTLSRFSYGIAVKVSELSPESGTGIVLTTIGEPARHWFSNSRFDDTAFGESFLVDAGLAEYRVEFQPDHQQINLSFQHDMLADLYGRWYGAPPDPRMWKQTVKFGGLQSSWMALLEYASRCVIDMPEEAENGPLGKHLEELLGMHLLMQWRQGMGLEHSRPVPRLAPVYVRRAEEFICAHAHEAPTLTAIAAAIGVSVRSLNRTFQEFRGYTPMDFLREKRYRAVRAALMAAPMGHTVAAVASLWGFTNLGLFAVNYKRKFGESPSQTLRRLRPR